MLFTNEIQLKEHFPITANFSFNTVKPYVLSAEQKWIQKIITKELFTLVNDDWLNSWVISQDDSNMQVKYRDLRNSILPALANFTALISIPILNVHFSAEGITVARNENLAPASNDRIEDLKDAVNSTAWQGVEALLEFMEENSADYPEWTSSDNYSINKSLFVSSVNIFQQHFDLKYSKYLFTSLVPELKKVELFFIKNEIGKELFDKIKTDILNNSVSEEYEYILKEYIQPAVVNFTIGKYIEKHIVDFSNYGISIVQNSVNNYKNKTKVSESTKHILENSYVKDAEYYISQLKAYIENNATLFPEFETSDKRTSINESSVIIEDRSGPGYSTLY